jgi:hypothetical protein
MFLLLFLPDDRRIRIRISGCLYDVDYLSLYTHVYNFNKPNINIFKNIPSNAHNSKSFFLKTVFSLKVYRGTYVTDEH